MTGLSGKNFPCDIASGATHSVALTVENNSILVAGLAIFGTTGLEKQGTKINQRRFYPIEDGLENCTVVKV